MPDTARPNNTPPSMPSDDDIDKRVYRRLPRPYAVEVTELVFPASSAVSMQTVCCDISLGGVCVEATATLFAPGATCQVRVLIPLLNKYGSSFLKVYENDAEQYFMALAEVSWIKTSGPNTLLGFRFVNTDQTQSQALEKLIAKAFAAED